MEEETHSTQSFGAGNVSVLAELLDKLQNAVGFDKKLQQIEDCSEIKEFLEKNRAFYSKLHEINEEKKYYIYAMLLLGQGPALKNMFEQVGFGGGTLSSFFAQLKAFDQFYAPLGGIVGYHLKFLQLQSRSAFDDNCEYLHPVGLDFTHNREPVREYVYEGLLALKTLCEIYPVGGAGERLGLIDEKTGKALPAACLPFCGKTLLEGMVHDLQAREYLYYKLFREQLKTPVIMMTSDEKDNDSHIENILAKADWFGRSKDLFFRFKQPGAPVLTDNAAWSFSSPFQFYTKPGGHGVLWLLCKQSGVFSWLRKQGKEKILVRQINNPAASTDSGLLAFIGCGGKHGKAFGFASCQRRVGAAEGMNVLVQKNEPQGSSYTISNVEYAEFEQKGILDHPAEAGSDYSAFPANTNILFGDLEAIEKAVEDTPYPGLLLNMKSKVPYIDDGGRQKQRIGGRLECMMQNIADAMRQVFSGPLPENEIESLKTFVTYYDRNKTISVAKKQFQTDGQLHETPEGCFYDLQKLMRQLFIECGFELPEERGESEYLKRGPSTNILLHPALGPVWEVIAQKIRGGSIAQGSDLRLEIAELDVEELQLNGSCIIEAENILGHFEEEQLRYSNRTGKCELRNVSIENKGAELEQDAPYWKNTVKYQERFSLLIYGNGEFFAENATFRGPYEIVVPPSHRMTAREEEGRIRFFLEPIDDASWQWEYSFDERKKILLKKTPCIL